MVSNAFNPCTWRAESNGFLNPGQAGIHRVYLHIICLYKYVILYMCKYILFLRSLNGVFCMDDSTFPRSHG